MLPDTPGSTPRRREAAMLTHEGSYDDQGGSENGYQNSARGFDRPNQNVFDLSMDYSDDEVLLDWEQYSGEAGTQKITPCLLRPVPSIIFCLFDLMRIPCFILSLRSNALGHKNQCPAGYATSCACNLVLFSNQEFVQQAKSWERHLPGKANNIGALTSDLSSTMCFLHSCFLHVSQWWVQACQSKACMHKHLQACVSAAFAGLGQAMHNLHNSCRLLASSLAFRSSFTPVHNSSSVHERGAIHVPFPTFATLRNDGAMQRLSTSRRRDACILSGLHRHAEVPRLRVRVELAHTLPPRTHHAPRVVVPLLPAAAAHPAGPDRECCCAGHHPHCPCRGRGHAWRPFAFCPWWL